MCFNLHVFCGKCAPPLLSFSLFPSFEILHHIYATRRYQSKSEKTTKWKRFFPIQLGLSLSNNRIMTDHSVLKRKIEFITFWHAYDTMHFHSACRPLNRLQLHSDIFYEWNSCIFGTYSLIRTEYMNKSNYHAVVLLTWTGCECEIVAGNPLWTAMGRKCNRRA